MINSHDGYSPTRHPRITVRMRVFLLNLCVVVLGFVLFSAMLVGITINRETAQRIESARSALSQTASLLQSHVLTLRSQIDRATLNENMIALMEAEKQYDRLLDWNADRLAIETIVNEAIYLSDISAVRIITDNAMASQGFSRMLMPLSDAKGTAWAARIFNRSDTYFWTPSADLGAAGLGETYVAFTRNLTYSYPTYHTYFVGFVPKAFFENTLSINMTDEYTSYYILNGSNRLLLGDPGAIGADNYKTLGETIRLRQEKSDAPIEVQPVSVNGHRFLLGTHRIGTTDMTVVYAFALSQMAGALLWENAARMALILLSILPLVLLLSAGISISLTRPIERLTRRMQDVSMGDFSPVKLPAAPDREMNVLIRTFGDLTHRIAELMAEQAEAALKIRDLELRALQAQINPHFLYNTLGLIRYKAKRDNNQEIQMLVTALTAYYKKGLSCGRDIVSLQDELEHLRSYMQIQNMRFEAHIELFTLIDPECLQAMIPKITLQPLAENAIEHGILEKYAQGGAILLRAWREQDMLVLVMVDNGAGMEAEAAAMLPGEETSASPLHSGYGLRNILERLRLHFGPAARMDFIGSPGRGLAVMLFVPFTTSSE